mmetsp:Transcript_14400/g.38559  ORF Transcript_14400/g.38559 Transcript_14400/m.38559 type:complete len:211 (+) Transcript_14400:103-735(+)
MAFVGAAQMRSIVVKKRAHSESLHCRRAERFCFDGKSTAVRTRRARCAERRELKCCAESALATSAAVVESSRGLALFVRLAAEEASTSEFAVRGVTAQDTLVFVVGSVPFVIATWQFWTRIAKGQRFGTGKDSVVFDTGRKPREDSTSALGTNDGSSAGAEKPAKRATAQRTLSPAALKIAYALTAAMLFSYALVALEIVSLPAVSQSAP